MDQTAIMDSIAMSLGSIAGSLEEIERLLRGGQPINEAPEYTADIGRYLTFDWSSIDATVEDSDEFGPRSVRWNGKSYYRRSPENKFGEAIFFSKSSGHRDEGGNVVFHRLITFRKPTDVGPISRGAEKAIAKGVSGQPARATGSNLSTTQPEQTKKKPTSIGAGNAGTAFRSWAMKFAESTGHYRLPSGTADIGAMLKTLGERGIELVCEETLTQCVAILEEALTE
jgi:hypothetical protein